MTPTQAKDLKSGDRLRVTNDWSCNRKEQGRVIVVSVVDKNCMIFDVGGDIWDPDEVELFERV
jgi:hypothetical protein